MSLDKGLLLYLIQVPAISFIDFFFHCYLDFISFISTLVFMIFFLWPMLGLIWSFSLGPLGVYLDFFFMYFFCLFLQVDPYHQKLLKTAFASSITFWTLCFPLTLSQDIFLKFPLFSSLTHWWFSRMLISLQMFVLFFPYKWVFILLWSNIV